MARPLVDRFWEKVDRRGPDDCWPWLAVRSSFGHGFIMAEGGSYLPKVGAHRVSYEINVGPIPAGLQVLHRCDNPACVNPAHLFLGDQRENVRDMDRKGRRRVWHPQGERNPASKLDAAKVREIRSLLPHMSKRAIGRRFSVSEVLIGHIARRQSWAHVT